QINQATPGPDLQACVTQEVVTNVKGWCYIDPIQDTSHNNDIVANAAVPFDMFTSTPDYSPFEYVPRKWTDGSCNAVGTRSAVEAEAWGWDFTDPDDQPGLSEQVWRMLHVGEI
ncbi:MAG: hypothetical protein CVU63_05940, partial [Deltaproteobacteria bacterium HGW-Deltaproteobacteria-20]